ncbi:MAG: hypothetical protein JSV77_03430 [Dehalococcoidales bacterium]|nr:MAG: hypothetical protein JSV77_03430 [Dehalococcoidales bacterium]
MIVFKLAAVVIVLSAISTGGFGCDAFEDINCEGGNYINVAISASISAEVFDFVSNKDVPWPGILLQIEITKDGGELVTCRGTTNEYGDVPETCQGTFKVYKNQGVKITVSPLGDVLLPDSMGGGLWDPGSNTLQNYKHYLRWDELEDCSWGETYFWDPTIKIQTYVNLH